ncbi:CHAT domain-containing protein, partial [Kibdelosporangium lantanae]
ALLGFATDQGPTVQEKAGKPVSYLKFADFGLNFYSNGLLTAQKNLTGKKDLVTRMVAATSEAWTAAQNDPQGSGILLADGRCTVADLMKLRLDCELVTFSACETGLAEQAPGDELIGLTRALIYAGARAVLVSLWRVDEISTSILMRAFYRARTQGVDKVTALSQAQHELRTMTAADAITYCQEAVRHVDEPFTIEQDIANLRFRARDFATAEAEYAALAERTPPDTPRYRTLTASVARARRARRVETTVDYGVRPYQRPYHWAPFVLFGDWR